MRRCLDAGINCIAITDHGTIEGALRTREIAPFPVVIGQEVYTKEGEIMGFYLTQSIPHGFSATETAARIKDQGGIVGIPHPFDYFTRRAGGKRLVEGLLPHLSTLEVFNARSIFSFSSAARFARANHLLPTAGSDAHTIREIGTAYMEMPEFTNAPELLSSLSQGKVGGHRSPFWVHFIGSRNHKKQWRRRLFHA